jgi:hypothetical protein
MLEGTLNLLQRIYRNINLKFWTKFVNCFGKWVTGNVASVRRMWRVTAQKLRGFSAQEHDTDTKNPTVLNCGIFHLQNTFQCTCIRYNLVLFAVFFSLTFWVSHLINQNNANKFCKIRSYLLFCNTFKIAPPKRAHWSTYQLMSQCCPLLPCYPPHCCCTDITFVCVHLYDWRWDCYGLLVVKCGGSAHYWMQYCDIN